MPKVVVVTDSSASLPLETARRLGILVVPLQVVIGTRSFADGIDPEASPDQVADALERRLPVSTSRPTPELVLAHYERAAAAGAEAIVSVHLSAEVSATYESAVLAARSSVVPVSVVDTRQIGAGTGYAAVAAAEAAAEGGTAEEAAGRAAARAAAVVSLFYVDTLEHLRRGGRLGAAAALVGSALAVKPILRVEEGRIVVVEKVRTSTRALARLEELAVAAAADLDVDVTVSHLANPRPAETLSRSLAGRLATQLGPRPVTVGEVAAVLAAHVGPGLVGVTISPR